jgi:DNA-binding response OmpR family regulator
MPTVFVVGRDWKLRASVRAELREAGVEALGMESADDLARALAGGTLPTVVVVEAGGDAATHAALTLLGKRVPLVVVASRTEPAPAVETAAAVLYRPVRVEDVVAQVKQLLQGRPA